MTGDMDPKTNFSLIVIQTELERYKFLVRSYLRARIAKVSRRTEYPLRPPKQKIRNTTLLPRQSVAKQASETNSMQIDKHTLHYLSSEDLRSRLSSTELAYATRHQALLHNHYLSSFLGSFPEKLQNLNDTAGNISMIDSPDVDSVVFIRMLRDKDVHGEGTDADNTLAASDGDVLILRWSSARQLVLDQHAELV